MYLHPSSPISTFSTAKTILVTTALSSSLLRSSTRCCCYLRKPLLAKMKRFSKLPYSHTTHRSILQIFRLQDFSHRAFTSTPSFLCLFIRASIFSDLLKCLALTSPQTSLPHSFYFSLSQQPRCSRIHYQSPTSTSTQSTLPKTHCSPTNFGVVPQIIPKNARASLATTIVHPVVPLHGDRKSARAKASAAVLRTAVPHSNLFC